jgi:Flp pilus assembly pilin Flp
MEISKKNSLTYILKNRSGQSLLEYLLLTALIAVGTMGIVRVMGHSISGKFAQITQVIQGKEANIKYEQVEESQYKKKDMKDFMNGAVSHK